MHHTATVHFISIFTLLMNCLMRASCKATGENSDSNASKMVLQYTIPLLPTLDLFIPGSQMMYMCRIH